MVIAGGGVTGLEALLALHDLAGERAEMTLVAPEPDFVYKPLLVEEPFDLAPAERHELEPLTSELGARVVQRALRAVRPEDHEVELDDGSTLAYDELIVCVGGRFRPAFEDAITFPSGLESFRADEVIDRAEQADHRIAFIVPEGVSWPLPLYELALMCRRRAAERGVEVQIAIVSPEPSPLAVFGVAPSEALAGLLEARGIDFVGDSAVSELGPRGIIKLSPRERVLSPAVVVALPRMEGPSIEGLPSDQAGFIPIDSHARVRGIEHVYAAGDGTNFPIKQGGLGAQQADAAAEHIAHRLGATGMPEPFRPVLRGKLVTGEETLSMRSDVAGGGGEGEASPDSLWWPPHKISARYLAPFLYHGDIHIEPVSSVRSFDIEVELPESWHQQPEALDPHDPGVG